MSQLWDKYSRSDKQTIVIIAVLILSAKDKRALHNFTRSYLEAFKNLTPRALRILVDVDPLSLL